ncbi:MAG: hypothetical protein H6Q69_700 [Firmicutes bacterium]|nr:hypothetical protein [Bacillota bacterium]
MRQKMRNHHSSSRFLAGARKYAKHIYLTKLIYNSQIKSTQCCAELTLQSLCTFLLAYTELKREHSLIAFISFYGIIINL